MTTQRRSPSPQTTNEPARILEALLAEHGTELRRQAARHAGPEHAEDALQDACCQLLRCYQGPPGLDALRWMMTTTKRCAWATARRERRPRLPLSTTDALEADPTTETVAVADERPGPDALAERHDHHAWACASIARLKPDERTALVLFGLGCSYREIGELRGWTYTKVNRCINEGRSALRTDRI